MDKIRGSSNVSNIWNNMVKMEEQIFKGLQLREESNEN